MSSFDIPGVYPQRVEPAPVIDFTTGLSVFLGIANNGPENTAQLVRSWPEYQELFISEANPHVGILSHTVRGYFENGGRTCYVIRLPGDTVTQQSLQDGLSVLDPIDDADLICAPDIVFPAQNAAMVEVLQREIIAHCDTPRAHRFAILDSLSRTNEGDDAIASVESQSRSLNSINAALYFPWVKVANYPAVPLDSADPPPDFILVPPSGHVAGIYSRLDRRFGVHKAPANEIVEGVLDVGIPLTTSQQRTLSRGDSGLRTVNYLRSLPGRGIRVWGAWTTSGEAEWHYVNVRRLVLTLGRWIEFRLSDLAFEPHDPGLWARVKRELTGYLEGLHERGALKGTTPQEAFYVKCDEETNPREIREAGEIITEIGLVPSIPYEFIIVRIVQGASGVSIEGPAGSN